MKFAPVKLGLFRREYEAMLTYADAEIEKIRNNEASYIRTMFPEAKELIEKLIREGKVGRAAEVRARSDSYRKDGHHPQAAETLRAWRARKSEIQSVMNGVLAAEPGRAQRGPD